MENVFDWYVMSAEPSVILKIPSEHETIDSCVIALLQAASCMKQLPKDNQNVQKTVVTAKRMAYVRSIVRLLKGSDAKLHQLMSTKQGQEMFHQACMVLLTSIESCFTDGNDDMTMEATSLLIPIIQSMSVPESTAKLFTSAIGLWQSSSQTGNVTLCCMLNALKVQKQWSLSVFQVLESSLQNYMRVSGKTLKKNLRKLFLLSINISDMSPNHNPTWQDALQRFGPNQVNFDQNLLIHNDLLLAAYILSCSKLQTCADDVDRVTFLQEMQFKLAEKKTSLEMEAKVMLLWGFLIMSGGHILRRSDLSKNQLLSIARYFVLNTNQPEGWGEGLLGAIGLLKESQSNNKKILLRALSCAVFAIFAEQFKDASDTKPSTEFESSMAEMRSTLSNKKFADVRATGLQALSLIESKKETMLDDFNDTISRLIRFFYAEPFLNSIEYFNHW